MHAFLESLPSCPFKCNGHLRICFANQIFVLYVLSDLLLLVVVGHLVVIECAQIVQTGEIQFLHALHGHVVLLRD